MSIQQPHPNIQFIKHKGIILDTKEIKDRKLSLLELHSKLHLEPVSNTINCQSKCYKLAIRYTIRYTRCSLPENTQSQMKMFGKLDNYIFGFLNWKTGSGSGLPAVFSRQRTGATQQYIPMQEKSSCSSQQGQ